MSMDLGQMQALQRAQERAEAMQPNKQQQFMLTALSMIIEMMRINPEMFKDFDDVMSKAEKLKQKIDRAN